ncbi:MULTISPECIES: hypothetical protein [unclassified Streptomyces]|uniref:DUF695 domain-containing protein n=1 Tax=Streptomyces sp. NBC_00119 TaxID=2975659 RepID=A0AAU1UMC9_9ACTN|nr:MULTISPECIES: hypothetical protein [unclassified Streptomyces]MCX4649221.1 hypothetical protein [Streptomyces sp. NBC_01446]MCX5321570.1 hypothetical protein [Streptomyces sp. NBC_00120]
MREAVAFLIRSREIRPDSSAGPVDFVLHDVDCEGRARELAAALHAALYGDLEPLERIKAETAAYFRALDERATLRYRFRGADEESGLWYFEAVPDRGELVAIKQAKPTSAGQLHRYSWEHLEDEHGFLTDQAMDPEEDPLEAIGPKSSSGCGAGEGAGQPL